MSNPLENCLKSCHRIIRREFVRLRLYSEGRISPRTRYGDGEHPIMEPTWWELIQPLCLDSRVNPDSPRTKVIAAACRLGASPIEMSLLLDRIAEGIWNLLDWDKNHPKPEEIWGVFEPLETELDNIMTPLEDLCALNRLSRGKPEPDQSTTIVSHGERLYSIGHRTPIEVTDKEDDVLQAFLERPAMTSNTLSDISGHTTEQAVNILRGLRSKYKAVFALAIHFPGHKAHGGYNVRIDRAVSHQ